MNATSTGWANANIGTIADVQLGKMLDKLKNKGDPTSYLRNVNVRWGEFDLSDLALMQMTDAERQSFKIQDGDLMVCEGGEPGRAAIWRGGNTDIAFQKALMRVRPFGGIEPKFLLAYLKKSAFAGELEGYFTGTTIKHLPQNALKAVALPLAPLAEQHRIVAKLDALTARTARARADLDRVERLGPRYRLALLRTAMLGRLTETWRSQQGGLESAVDLVARTKAVVQGRGGREATTELIDGQAALSVNKPPREIPIQWAWIPLLSIARQETGHTPSRSVDEYWNGGVPWVGIKDAGAYHGKEINSTFQTISELGLENSSARLLPRGTVCLSRTASVGYVTILGRAMATSQDFATWTCSSALEPKFLMYALMAEGDDIRAFGKGSTHTTIYFPEIRALQIALPPLAEQAEIVRRIEVGLADIERLTSEASAARRLLDRLDQAILSKAFRGELVPQDPADEPASVLLERIKSERAAAPAGVRRGRRPRAA